MKVESFARKKNCKKVTPLFVISFQIQETTGSLIILLYDILSISSPCVIHCRVRMAHLYVYVYVWVSVSSWSWRGGGRCNWSIWCEKLRKLETTSLRESSGSVNSRGSVYCDSVVENHVVIMQYHCSVWYHTVV